MTIFKTKDGKYFILDNATTIRPDNVDHRKYIIEFPAMTDVERMDYWIEDRDDVKNLKMLLDKELDSTIYKVPSNGQD